jgi:hypothetical protein
MIEELEMITEGTVVACSKPPPGIRLVGLEIPREYVVNVFGGPAEIHTGQFPIKSPNRYLLPIHGFRGRL